MLIKHWMTLDLDELASDLSELDDEQILEFVSNILNGALDITLAKQIVDHTQGWITAAEEGQE